MEQRKQAKNSNDWIKTKLVLPRVGEKEIERLSSAQKRIILGRGNSDTIKRGNKKRYISATMCKRQEGDITSTAINSRKNKSRSNMY